MDIRIRKNEKCVIGMPQCDYVFSSTRSCFIAYGYNDSSLEKDLLCDLLRSKGIEPIEAGGSLAPAQAVFCAKICSKVIASQFCIILINNEVVGDREIPNANVNMEYGLMLGFNKLVLPFQKADQKLPFNVAGLDTIKYTDKSFRQLASQAIDEAITATDQKQFDTVDVDQNIKLFLLINHMLFCQLLNDGEKNLYHLGSPLGFNLLNDFSGMNVVYFGNFTAFRPDNIVWRVSLLCDILTERFSSLGVKVEYELITCKQKEFTEKISLKTQVWVLVNTEEDKGKVIEMLSDRVVSHTWSVYSLDDVTSELEIIVQK